MNNGTRELEYARKFIYANWEKMTDTQMSIHLFMNLVSIRRLRYRMGLVRGVKKGV